MPSSVRKSSVGLAGRRGPQKAHIPFRADDLEHGKKTGLAVTYVDHKSDDFEPFSEVMQQADGRTPARKKRKSTVTKKTVVEEEVGDEDGEMSMELDNSTRFTPTESICIELILSLNRYCITFSLFYKYP